jgi:hypothetical protein
MVSMGQRAAWSKSASCEKAYDRRHRCCKQPLSCSNLATAQGQGVLSIQSLLSHQAVKHVRYDGKDSRMI